MSTNRHANEAAEVVGDDDDHEQEKEEEKHEEVNDKFPPVTATLSRRDLQQQLKNWGVRATGTTVALQERYEAERRQRFGSSNNNININTSKGGSSTTAATTQPSPPPPPPVVEEKRRRPFRSSCPEGIRQRIGRAKTQRLYLIHRGDITENNSKCEFAVLGSTGNVYHVTIAHLPKCNCPDFAKGHNHLCKHILFVLLKVMAVDERSPHLYQAAWLTSELQDMFENFMQRRGILNSNSNSNNAVLANDQVRLAYAKLQAGETLEQNDEGPTEDADGAVVRKQLDDDNCDCPICFDSMLEDTPDKLTYCRTACGYNFHVDCIRRWCQQQERSSSGRATCPNCRQPWDVKTKSTGDDSAADEEGYTNLGQLQGQSPVRDVSTYSRWYGNNKRRRYY